MATLNEIVKINKFHIVYSYVKAKIKIRAGHLYEILKKKKLTSGTASSSILSCFLFSLFNFHF